MGERSALVFEIDDVEHERTRGGDSYVEFLKRSSLRVGLYVLPADGVDDQTPHEEDEVYYVLRGRGTFRADGVDYPVRPGSIVFVRARVDHRFHTFRDGLELLVFFSSAPSST